MRKRFLPTMLGLAAMSAVSGNFAAAQARGNSSAPMARHIPADALLYLGWRGGPAVRKQYDASRMKAILRDTNARQLFAPLIKQSMASAPAQEKRMIHQMLQLLTIVARHRAAFFFGDHVAAKHGQPVALLAIRAGRDRAAARMVMQALATEIDHSERKDTHPSQTIVYGFGPDLIMQITNRGNKRRYFGGPGKGGLADLKAFVSSMRQVQAGEPLIAYIDAAPLVRRIEAESPGRLTPHGRVGIRLLQAWGLYDIARIAYTGGFDGRDWRSAAYVQTHGHAGYLGMAAQAPALRQGLLRVIPASAVNVRAGRLNINQIVMTIMKSDHKVAAQWRASFHAMHKMMGVSIRRELADPLTGSWVTYEARETTGLVSSPVFIHPLAHPNAFKKTLQTVTMRLNAMLRNQKAPFVFVKLRRGKVHYETFQSIFATAPTFAVAHHNLYFALSVKAVLAAADGAYGKKSIHSNPVFAKLMRRLSVPSRANVAITYMDTHLVAGHVLTYVRETLLPILRAQQVVPPNLKIRAYASALKQISPLLSATWTDGHGLHSRFLGPIPGIQYVGIPSMLDGSEIPDALVGRFVSGFLQNYRHAQNNGGS